MEPPKVRVNTFVKTYQNSIDWISTVFLTSGLAFGVNRIVVLKLRTQHVYKILAWLYTVVIYSIIIFVTIMHSDCDFLDILHLIEYLFHVLFAVVSGKRLFYYYAELNRFDNEAGCELKVTPTSKLNLLYLFCNTILIIVFISFSYLTSPRHLIMHLIPVHTMQVIELYFYGHLLSLLILRIKFINFYVESSLMNGHDASYSYTTKFVIFKIKNANKSNYEIAKLMKLYEIVIRAYDRLINAVKWSLLVILTMAFMGVLMMCYIVSLGVIRGNDNWVIILCGGGLTMSRMLSLAALCKLSDQLRQEVRNLRELLSVKLYEDNMDKKSRGVTRSMIALTHTRDLAFLLFRMLNIDVSLPFKFMALVITYLIILLQFQKFINP